MWDENQLGLVIQKENSSASGENLLDPAYAQFRDQSRFWVQRVAVPLIMVVGLFGNLVTVIIMTRRRMRSTTNLYLAALALVDMLYLVLTFLLGLSHYPNITGPAYHLYWQLKPFLMMLTDACSNTSVWLTVTFTIERFIAVKYPMKGKVWCTEARAKRLIVFVFLFGILFASPVPFEWKVVVKPIQREQTKQLESVKSRDDFVGANETTHNQPRPLWDHHNGSETTTMTTIEGRPGDKVHDTTIESGASGGVGGDNEISRFPVGWKKYDREDEDEEDGGDTKDEIVGPNDDSRKRDQILNGATNQMGAKTSYILTLENSDFGRNVTYKTIYYWLTALFFYFIPLLSLTFFNGFLILSVHRSFRERKRMTTGQQTLGRNQQYGPPSYQPLPDARSRAKSDQSSNHKRSAKLVIPTISLESNKRITTVNSRNGVGGSTTTTTMATTTTTTTMVVDDNNYEDATSNQMVCDGRAQTNGKAKQLELLGAMSAATSKRTTDDVSDRHEIVNTCFTKSNKLESDTCQHHGLISRSDLEVPLVDKTTEQTGCDQQLNESPNGIAQHEIERTSKRAPVSEGIGAAGETQTARVVVERRVEFNCDVDNNNSDGTFNVQTNCDRANSKADSHRTDGMVNRLDISRDDESTTKDVVVVVPILRTTTANGASNIVTECQINQPAPTDDADGADACLSYPRSPLGLGNVKQKPKSSDSTIDSEQVMAAMAAAAAAATTQQENIQPCFQFVKSDLVTNEMAALTYIEATDNTSGGGSSTSSSNGSNNGGQHVASLEPTSYISGRLQLATLTMSNNSNNSSGGLAPNSGSINNNYESGSCTTIQTNASLVPASTQERRITIILIAVVILFICCQIPSAALILYTSVREPAPNTNEQALVVAFSNIFNFLMAVNAASNFILYSFLSTKYRKTFVILFCHCFKSKNADSDERSTNARTGYYTSQQMLAVHSTSSGGLLEENSTNSKSNGRGRLGRWTNANVVRTASSNSKQPSEDLASFLVSSNFVKNQRRDTLV